MEVPARPSSLLGRTNLSASPLKTLQHSIRRGRAARRTKTREGDALIRIVEDKEWIARRFCASSLQPKATPKQKQKEDLYVNTGYAVRALREQLPAVFYKQPSFDIYRDDIVFRDPINTFSGIGNYKLILWVLRFHGRIFFKALWIDILRIWHPSENVIMVRWTVYGIPRGPWEAQGCFDGTSEYKLDSDGKIYEHKVDNVELNSPPKFGVPVVENLIRALGCPSTPKPTYFEVTGTLFWLLFPYLIQFTWVCYYFAMKGTIDMKNPSTGFNSL